VTQVSQLDKLETVLDEKLNRKAPFKLPSNGRKTLASSMWWIALIFGVLQLWVAWDLWQLGHAVSNFVDYANAVARAYGGEGVNDGLGFFYYVSMLVLVVDAVLLLLAAPALKEMRKTGWNLLFYGLLLNVGYGVVRMFAGHGGGFDDLLWAIVSSLIGAFLLFQVRDYFVMSKAHKAESKPTAHEHAAHKEKESKE
jgi:hypothetical protein